MKGHTASEWVVFIGFNLGLLSGLVGLALQSLYVLVAAIWILALVLVSEAVARD